MSESYIAELMRVAQGMEESVRLKPKYPGKFDEKWLYGRFNLRETACFLGIRPAGVPDIIEEFNISKDKPLKIMLYQHQSPGDIVVFTSVIRDLHKAYPGMFQTGVDTSVQPLLDNNKYLTNLKRNDGDVLHIQCTYTEFISSSCQNNTHFLHAFHRDLELKTGLRIPLTAGKGDITLSDEEKGWTSRVQELLEADRPYWIIDAGRKSDFTTKLWAIDRFQEVVSAFPNVTFVQIGADSKDHYHPPMEGDNVINEVGNTTIRQMVRLMYHAYGVITPVSFPMHLSAAVEPHPKYNFKHRPTIVLAGAREPSSWEAYNAHSFLHNVGQIPCGGLGGCWKARVERLGDGDKKDNDTCTNPIKLASGQTIPKCLDMISAQQVIDIMKTYLSNYQ